MSILLFAGNYDVLFSYLSSHNYDFQYDKLHNVRPKRNIRMAMQHEVMMYAIAQSKFSALKLTHCSPVVLVDVC